MPSQHDGYEVVIPDTQLQAGLFCPSSENRNEKNKDLSVGEVVSSCRLMHRVTQRQRLQQAGSGSQKTEFPRDWELKSLSKLQWPCGKHAKQRSALLKHFSSLHQRVQTAPALLAVALGPAAAHQPQCRWHSAVAHVGAGGTDKSNPGTGRTKQSCPAALDRFSLHSAGCCCHWPRSCLLACLLASVHLS